MFYIDKVRLSAAVNNDIEVVETISVSYKNRYVEASQSLRILLLDMIDVTL
jgi:hypothetical protein